MITEYQTNKLFLADCLPKKYPDFFHRIERQLNENEINFQFLPKTGDILAVDYMPVQVSKNKFIQFTYNPDYLQSKKWLKSISDVPGICNHLSLSPVKSDLVVDGGNVIRWLNKVIICDKVFHENQKYAESEVISQLKKLFEVEKIILVPRDKSDIIGHADGMVRFVN